MSSQEGCMIVEPNDKEKLAKNDIFKKCESLLQSVINGNVFDLVQFTPILFQYMTSDLPEEPMQMTKELGLRGANILAMTQKICDETEMKENNEANTYIVSKRTAEYFLVYFLGYCVTIEQAQLCSALVFLKLLLDTDKFSNVKMTIESNRIALYTCAFVSNYDSYTLFYNFIHTSICILLWEYGPGLISLL